MEGTVQRCILHFGMHKTGSTAIQESLFRYLEDGRFHYVNFGAANSSGKLLTAFLADPSKFHGNRKRGGTKESLARERAEIIHRLREELGRRPGSTKIISAEGLSQLNESEFREMVELIRGTGHQVTAVGYIRSPMRFMESVFQQRVKGGLNRFGVAQAYPNYRQRLEKLEAVLGADNVHYWPFDPKEFPSRCVVQDFCRRLEIGFSPADVVRLNEAISREAVSLLYTYYKLGKGYGFGPTVIRENGLLIARVALLRGRKLRFHPSLVMTAIEQKMDDLKWMESRLGAPLLEDVEEIERDAIRSEADLLTFEPETLVWLADQLGPEYACRVRSNMSPEEVADWVHALREKLVKEHQGLQIKFNKEGRNAKSLDPRVRAMVRQARESSLELRSLPEEGAALLVQEVLAQMRHDIEGLNDGVYDFPGLGQFSVVQREGGKVLQRVMRNGEVKKSD